MECCSLEVMAELLLEPVFSSPKKHRSCLIHGENLPEVTCDYLCCAMYYFLEASLQKMKKGQILLKLPEVFHPSQGHGRGRSFQIDLTILKGSSKTWHLLCRWRSVLEIKCKAHVVVNSQALESDRKPNPYNCQPSWKLCSLQAYTI